MGHGSAKDEWLDEERGMANEQQYRTECKWAPGESVPMGGVGKRGERVPIQP